MYISNCEVDSHNSKNIQATKHHLIKLIQIATISSKQSQPCLDSLAVLHSSRIRILSSELYIPNPCSISGLILQEPAAACSICLYSSIQACYLEEVPLSESEMVFLCIFLSTMFIYFVYISYNIFISLLFILKLYKQRCHLLVFCYSWVPL